MSKFSETLGFSILAGNWNREGEYSVKVTTPNYKNSNQSESNNKDNDCSMMAAYLNGVHDCSQVCSLPIYETKLQHD